MGGYERIPILAAPVGESLNPPDYPVILCLGCQDLLSIDRRSEELINTDPRYQVWCWRCAAGKWPDMEILNTDGTWVWTEECDGIEVGQIHVGRLPLRGWIRGAKREGGVS